MTHPLQRLEQLGFRLPTAPAPVANYLPAVCCGNMLYTSGQIPMKDGTLAYRGSVPSSQTIEDAVVAAQLCGLNVLAVAASNLDGDLGRIERVIHLRVFVASDPDFDGHSTIANGVSDLMVAVFGEVGKHTRVAMGCIGLPLGATVEVEGTFEISQ